MVVGAFGGAFVVGLPVALAHTFVGGPVGGLLRSAVATCGVSSSGCCDGAANPLIVVFVVTPRAFKLWFDMHLVLGRTTDNNGHQTPHELDEPYTNSCHSTVYSSQTPCLAE